MMKTAFLILFSCFSLLTTYAQRNEPRDPRARERIRAAHAAYLTQRLELTPAEAERFWPVYNQYRDERMELRGTYARKKRNEPDDQKTLELDLEMKQAELDLEKSYSRRLAEIISPEKLLRLREAEEDFRKLVLRQIQQRRVR